MPGAHRAARRPAARLHHGGRRGRARGGPAPGDDGPRRGPRPAPRRAAGLQGSLLHPRAAHLLRHADAPSTSPPSTTAPRWPGSSRAGAVTLGKLNMTELAMGALGDNPHHGHARNPWNLERCTGGSSSGSGVAVAAGPRAGRHRHRHRRLDPAARGRLRHHRAQADLRPGEPRGRDGAVLVERSPGAHGAHRAGLRAHAAGDGGRRSARRDRERAAGARLSRGARRAGRRPAGRRSGELLLPGDRRGDGGGGARPRSPRSPRSGRGSPSCGCPIRR